MLSWKAMDGVQGLKDINSLHKLSERSQVNSSDRLTMSDWRLSLAAGWRSTCAFEVLCTEMKAEKYKPLGERMRQYVNNENVCITPFSRMIYRVPCWLDPF